MKSSKSILIIDDHQIIIDTYKRAINLVSDYFENIELIIYEASNCDEAMSILNSMDNSIQLDLVILDINLPASSEYDILNGECLGKIILEKFDGCRLLVCTAYNNNLRLVNILNNLNPDGFLIKADINFSDLVFAIRKIFDNESYYSKTIISLMRNKLNTEIILDKLDIDILSETSNGATMKELIEIIPLSRAGIEKRKRRIKVLFKINSNSDRDLVLIARKKGFI